MKIASIFNFYTNAQKRRSILRYMTIVFFLAFVIRIFVTASFFSFSSSTVADVCSYVLAVAALVEIIFVFPDLKPVIKGLWIILIPLLIFLFFHHTQVKEYVCGTMVFLTALTVLPKVKFSRLEVSMILGTYVVYAVLVCLFVNRDRYDYSTAIYMNPNTTSYLLLCVGMVLAAFADTVTLKRISIPLYVLSAASFIGILVFGGRAAIITAILFIVFLLFRKFFRKASKRTVGILCFALCIGSILFAYFFSELLYDWVGKGNLVIFGKDIFTGRQKVWSDAFEQIRGRWLLGIGNTLSSVNGTPTYLDNQMMGYFVCFGAITLVLIIALLVNLLVEACASRKMLVAGVLVLLVGAFFETYFFYHTTVSFTCLTLFVFRYADQCGATRKVLKGKRFATMQAEKKLPLISVIIPVYNVEKYLQECVRSVAAQSYQNLEILLVNDGSKDGSLAVCRALASEDGRIRVIDKKNGGVSSARNAGLDAAKGELIAFVDGDDYIDADTYEKLYMAMIKKDADIVFCRFQKEYGEGKTVLYNEKRLKKLGKKPWDFSSLFDYSVSKELDQAVTDNVHGSVCRSLFKKTTIERNELRFVEGMAIWEDKLFLLKYLSSCEKGALVDAYLYHYRVEREGSAITVFSNNYKRYYEQLKERLDDFSGAICGNGKLSEKQKERLLFLENFDIAFSYAVRTLRFETRHDKAVEALNEDSFIQETFKKATAKKLFKYNVSLKRIVLTVLLRKKKYGMLRKVIKFA